MNAKASKSRHDRMKIVTTIDVDEEPRGKHQIDLEQGYLVAFEKKKKSLHLSFFFPLAAEYDFSINDRRYSGRNPDGFRHFSTTIPMAPKVDLELSFNTGGERATASNKKLVDDLKALRESGAGADVIIFVRCAHDTKRTRQFPVHAPILRARSEFFRKRIADFSSGSGGPRRMDLDVDDLDAFESLLEYIYTGRVSPNVEFTGEALLAVAESFDLADMKLLVAEGLTKKIDVDNVCEILLIGFNHNCEGLKRACLLFMKENVDEVMKTEGWEKVSQSSELIKDCFSSFAH